MSKNMRTIVITYDGADLAPYTVQDLIETMCIKHGVCAPYDVTYMNFNEDEIAKLVAGALTSLKNQNKCFEVCEENKELPEDLKNTMIFLKNSRSLKSFNNNVLVGIFRDYIDESFNKLENRPLSSAIEILSKHSKNECIKASNLYGINAQMIVKIRNMFKEKSEMTWL